ncbi:hypothetical protein [Riemerella columbina]|uniref:hypothetical protein n=1 Tax=Riemerella columbina TaxID=103810 RepID=UPI00266F3F29|nr:hypothetical protein [Riemerella columbina]WKS95941.1 hypothetical protein NYR17_04190 [Riemerella columbina]
MMNPYKESILNGETKNFLLGKGKYFVLDRDFGEHDITATYMDMLNFGLENNEDTLYTQVNTDFIKILEDINLTLEDYTYLLGFILFYFKYKYVYNKLKNDWIIPKRLIEKINIKYIELKKLNNDMSNILRINNLIKQNYGFNILVDQND